MTDYQPTDEDLMFLNQVDMGYIGLTKPNIERHREPDQSAPAWELEIEEGDHLRIDEQGWE